MIRHKPLLPGTKRMKPRRAKPRPGNRAMTKAERREVQDAKESRCIPCLVWAEAGHMPMQDVAVCNDWNHVKSGNLRVNHRHGYPGCLWHHRRRIEVDGWTFAAMTKHFGPSLLDGSRLFHDTYGSDEELMKRHQEERL